LRLFDFPDPNLTSDHRAVTTVPLQQLFVLNSEFMVSQARALAARLTAKPEQDDVARIRDAFQLLYGRPPREQEILLGKRFLTAAGSADGDDEGNEDISLSPWERYAQVLLSANEFIFVD